MKHKSILKYILMISAATSMMSCNGDLDVMQDNKLSASNMWTTSTDVIQSTYGIYERMRSNFVDGYINVFYWARHVSATICGVQALNPGFRTTT